MLIILNESNKVSNQSQIAYVVDYIRIKVLVISRINYPKFQLNILLLIFCAYHPTTYIKRKYDVVVRITKFHQLMTFSQVHCYKTTKISD